MRVLILRDRRFLPPGFNHRLAVSYRAGSEVTIKRAWGAALIEAGDARELPIPPRRPEA